jgi:type IV pilus assembly protein PilB
MNASALSGLARRLVQDNLLNTEDTIEYLAASKRTGIGFVNYLVKESILDALTLVTVAAEEFGTPIYNLDAHI